MKKINDEKVYTSGYLRVVGDDDDAPEGVTTTNNASPISIEVINEENETEKKNPIISSHISLKNKLKPQNNKLNMKPQFRRRINMGKH
jgi:hypothetical protein